MRASGGMRRLSLRSPACISFAWLYLVWNTPLDAQSTHARTLDLRQKIFSPLVDCCRLLARLIVALFLLVTLSGTWPDNDSFSAQNIPQTSVPNDFRHVPSSASSAICTPHEPESILSCPSVCIASMLVVRIFGCCCSVC